MKWLTKAAHVANRVVPYAALLLALAGEPQCAAALSQLASGLPPSAPPLVSVN